MGGKNNIKEIVSAKNRIVLTPRLRLPALLYPPADWFGWMAITVVFYFSGARDHAHQSPLHLSRSSFPAPASSCQSRILSPHLFFFAPLAYSTDAISICLPRMATATTSIPPATKHLPPPAESPLRGLSAARGSPRGTTIMRPSVAPSRGLSAAAGLGAERPSERAAVAPRGAPRACGRAPMQGTALSAQGRDRSASRRRVSSDMEAGNAERPRRRCLSYFLGGVGAGRHCRHLL